MAATVLFEINHIKLTEEQDGILCLAIDDWELRDFVEDFLWDNFQITEDYAEFPDAGKTGLYKTYYASDVKADDLNNALSQLDVQEVERIYKLNN